MKKFLVVTGVLAVVGHFAWRWWLQSNADNAKAWAQGTDRIN
ncbi:MAG: DLW-39 family protein [Actinobacteria bacterium]|nr:DLW-39 family protein [Actinomycetota bacterium]